MRANTTTAPIIRWAGSKRKLLPRLVPFWNAGYNRYIEPFAGSAALFFALQPQQAILSDINAELIEALQIIRDEPESVYERLRRHPLGERSYYRLRARSPRNLNPLQRAARFVFLNRFCFNGLYRTNEAGQFNVPFAKRTTATLPSRGQFLRAAATLRSADLRCEDFEAILKATVRAGDFVYLDPPYAVANRRIFRQYGPDSFGLEDLNRVQAVLDEINARGADFVLSYAYCREASEAFNRWTPVRVYVQRNISGFATHRRRAAELIVTNIPKSR